MLNPRSPLACALLVMLLLCPDAFARSLAVGRQTQQANSDSTSERERGMKLYEQGNVAEAVVVLQAFVKRNKNDVRAWHYFGLALGQQGNTKDARKAHEKAAKGAAQLLRQHLTEAKLDLLPSVIDSLKAQLLEAADSADKYLALSEKPSADKVAEWRARAEELRGYLELGDQLRGEQNAGTLFNTETVTTKARILNKPAPQYSEEARQNGTTGTVILVLVLSANGQVRGIVPLLSLPHGLTEEAITVARQIRFIPATKNGKPVSQLIRVEYNFNVY